MKLAVTSASFSKDDGLKNKLASQWKGEIKYNLDGIRFKSNELLDFLEDVDAAIVGLDKITSPLLSGLPKLRFISKYGVGLDNIDLEACKMRGIEVGWTGGVNKLSVAEMTLGFSLTLIRNMYQSSFLLSRGTWKKNGGNQLSGKTFGIIGFGFVAKEVVRLLAPYNCKILVNDINSSAFEGTNFKNTEKDIIYRESDIISIHTPLTDKTQNMITLDVMRKMSNRPILINTARGGIICEEDVVKALDEGIISALAIDAYVDEPAPPASLIEREDVFCTPHIGGNAKEAVWDMGVSAIENLIKITSTR